MSAGSQQLRRFRRALRDGSGLEEACRAAGTLEDGTPAISLAEARIHVANDAKNPPPPEAYEIGQPRKEAAMAAAAKQEPQNGGEYKRPDAAKAFDIYDKQIKPKKAAIAEKRGDLSQPYDDIKEHAHFPRKVLDFIVHLEELEESKRDHYLLALSEGLQHRKLFLPRDLVTMADGNAGADVVQLGDRKRPQLATLAGDPNLQMGVPSDGDETDLADAGDDDFEEASEEELAAQEGRPGNDDGEEEHAEAAE